MLTFQGRSFNFPTYPFTIWSPKIRRTAFLKYIKFADLPDREAPKL